MMDSTLWMVRFSISFLFMAATILNLGFCADMKVIIKKIETESNPDYATSTGGVRTEDKQTVADIDFDLNQDMDENIYIQHKIKAKMGDKYQELITGQRVNFCEFASKPAGGMLLKTLYDEFRKYGNFVEKCPVKKGHYFLKGFKLDLNTLPPFTPPGDYNLEFHITTKVDKTYVDVWKVLSYFTITK